jgi:cyclophilin family peptidyl-prolyl cis-trans isomerase
MREVIVEVRYLQNFLFAVLGIFVVVVSVSAQEKKSSEPPANTPQKINTRPPEVVVNAPDPFDGASVEKMAQQCVALETEAGAIQIEMIPEVAPESVRNFLNLAATGALDTTTFSRVVKDFVIQGGNLSTSERWGLGLAKRMTRKLPDEPGLVKHIRGIVSMAPSRRSEQCKHAFLHTCGRRPSSRRKVFCIWQSN